MTQLLKSINTLNQFQEELFKPYNFQLKTDIKKDNLIIKVIIP